ncbi:MAG: thioredoxin domain-containing protein [Candidatus Gastranaerophilales bacterium]|nr:thioredoxin domain-containing protein [Candidatus Gastranaerophilales bacterium]
MFTKKNILIFIFAITGLALSLWLCKIYYDANFNPYAFSSFCSVNDLIDCDGVAKTSFSQFAGLPLSVWGVLLYCFILYLLFAPKLAQFRISKINLSHDDSLYFYPFKFSEVFKNPHSYIFCLSTLAFVLSMCLACISIFEIEKICVLCFTTYLVDFALAIVSKDYSKPALFELKQSFTDFIDAVKIKKYLITLIAVCSVFAGILVYLSQSKILTPQLKNIISEKISIDNVYSSGNTLGDKNAKLIVHEYMDYNCASCYLTNLSLKRLATELDGFLIVQHNMPLDPECNNLVTSGHEGSCRMARYALAAKKQGKYWEANEILFDKTPSSEKEIIKLLSHIKGIDKNKLISDANSQEIKDELKKDIDEALEKQIEGTPTIIINLKKTTGNIPYLDLKERLLNSGATEKSQK